MYNAGYLNAMQYIWLYFICKRISMLNYNDISAAESYAEDAATDVRPRTMRHLLRRYAAIAHAISSDFDYLRRRQHDV